MKITLQNLTKKFPARGKKERGEVVAVNDFNFEIPDGELVGLLGPSGCGKSTTLNLICALSQRNPAAADKKLAQLKQNLYQKLPNLDEFLQQYYVYYLYTNFLDIFEDYSFSKHLLLGIAKAHMLWVFIALYAEHKKQLTTDELAKIIAVYERRAPQIEDALKLL